MNSSQMKNIIVIKDLPSNLIDEAFVILKSNKKIKTLERVDKKHNVVDEKDNSNGYLLREAEMIISSYISNLEDKKEIHSHSVRIIENKYKRLKKITIVLSIVLLLNIIVDIFF